MKKLMLVCLVIFALMLDGSKITAEESERSKNDYSTEEINASVIRRQLKESFQLFDAVTDTGARLSLLINLLTAQAGIDQKEKNRLEKISSEINTQEQKLTLEITALNKLVMIFETNVYQSLPLPELKEIMAALTDKNNHHSAYLMKLNDYFSSLNRHGRIFAAYLLSIIENHSDINDLTRQYFSGSKRLAEELNTNPKLTQVDKIQLFERRDDINRGIDISQNIFSRLNDQSSQLKLISEGRTAMDIRDLLNWYFEFLTVIPDIIMTHNDAKRNLDALTNIKVKYK